MSFRIEKDTMGEVRVPSEKLWGAQTQRSLMNFAIGTEKMPTSLIHAFAILKSSCAKANHKLGRMDDKKLGLITQVCEEILADKHSGEFPLAIWQTGSGTQTNMNLNEVIAGRANQIAEEKILHPNDHVNMSQSSNDTFPTAMHIASVVEVQEKLLPALAVIEETLRRLEAENHQYVKTGRTHLQDAVPITFAQEISGWLSMITHSKTMIAQSLDGLYELALGGTAVGTGLNCPEGFAEAAADFVAEKTKLPFRTAENKFHALTAKDALVYSHGAIKALAGNLMKIANDVRWLSSGPRCGLGEIFIPENEPGSSIMPGKVNPTQCEALTMVAVQVMGNDVAVGIAASQGNFELNVYMPVAAYNYLQSVTLLTDAILSFNEHCLMGVKANPEKMSHYLHTSLMTVTALNPHVGYENGAKIAKKAHKENISLKEATLALELMTEEEFDKVYQPEKMV